MKQIPNFAYSVTQGGEVFSHHRNEFKALSTHVNGYLTVGLFCGGKQKRCLVHRLVAEAYIPNPEGLPEVNHIDGNKTNNHVSNLEWCTKSQNALHAFKLGLRKGGNNRGCINERSACSKPLEQLTMDGELVHTFPSIAEAHRQGFNQGCIGHVLTGARKQHKGFKWRLKETK